MDRELQAALWSFVKDRRDKLIFAQREYEEAQELLMRMHEAGPDDHLPTLDEVAAAGKEKETT